jgi:hypothetical protein
MSPWLALALVIILVGAFAILSRLHLLAIAITFWIAFAIGIAVIAAAGHQMTARWHLGPITGFEFWRVVVLSPEVMVFLFFMITDPRRRRRAESAVGSTRSRAPARGAADRAPGDGVLDEGRAASAPLDRVRGAARRRCADAAPAGCLRAAEPPPARSAVLTGAGRVRRVARASPASPRVQRRPSARAAVPVGTLPQLTVLHSRGVATQIGTTLAQQIAGDLVADLRVESDALRTRDKGARRHGCGGTRLQGLWAQIDAAGTGAIVVPERHVDKLELALETAVGQEPPIVVATATGTERLVTFHGTPAAAAFTGTKTPFTRTLELQLAGNRYLIVGSRGGTPEAVAPDSSAKLVSLRRRRSEIQNVAPAIGIDFEQNAFRTKATMDVTAMMGGGVCWLDIDGDGWLDLFAVNSYADDDLGYWLQHGGMPRSALFHNVKGRFTDISRSSGADVQLRGDGCVAGDFNGDGSTDIYVTASGNDALLWNDGKGHFSEGARRRRCHGLGLAHRRRRCRRERRRAARHLRLGLRRRERARPLGRRVPEQLRGRPRPSLPQHRQRRERPRSLPGSRQEGAA